MSETTNNLLALANQAVDQGDSKKARDLVSHVIRQTPDDPRAWYLMSQLTDVREQQVECLERVLAIVPGNPQALRRLQAIQDAPQRAAPPAIEAPPPTVIKPARPKATVGGVCAVMVLGLVAFCMISSVVSSLGPPKPTPVPDYKRDAYINCQVFIEDHLKSPSTAKFPGYYTLGRVNGLGDGLYETAMMVDAQNSFGAMIRSTFYCKVQNNAGKWQLIDLQEQ